MAEASDEEEALYQNLLDAGCTQAMIQECLALGRKQNTDELLHHLARHRKELLDTVHLHQKEIDCLDFLVYRLGKHHSRE